MEENLYLPGNPRYQPKELKSIFGYDNLYRKAIEVEIATLKTLHEIEVIPTADFKLLTDEVKKSLRQITTTMVDKVERETTHHDVRALVQIMQSRMEKGIARWVHIPLTSYDPLDTARSLQFLEAYEQATKISTAAVVGLMSKLVRENSQKLQVGRTHGQHALPITVGFWLATILSRIVYNWEMMDAASKALKGKISGAVGAYNAQLALGFISRTDGEGFEELVLKKLGLEPAPISTQILPPEPLAYFLFSATCLSASLAQFGRDCRHLMRSEIAEITESFESTQVGSSTMAHKRNPITFENLEGTYLKTKSEFGKVLDTMISEHQRDLVGSSIMRDFPIIIVNLQQQLNALTKTNKAGIPFLSRIKVDAERCQKNFEQSAELILAEPLYIALQMSGYEGDAHELVNRRLVPICQKTKKPLITILEELGQEDEGLKQLYESIPLGLKDMFLHPGDYTGQASLKAIQIANHADEVREQIIN